MADAAYARLVWRNHRGVLLFSIAVVAALQYLIVWLISTLDYAPAVAAAFEQLPPLIRTFFNEEFLTPPVRARRPPPSDSTTPCCWPCWPSTPSCCLHARLPARSSPAPLNCCWPHPIGRVRVGVTVWASGCAMLSLVVAGALAGSLSAVALHHGLDADLAGRLFRIGANLVLLFVLVLSLTLLISAFGREGQRTGVIGAGITVVFYFFHFLAKIWDRVEPIPAGEHFHLLPAQELMFDRRSFAVNASVLLAANAFVWPPPSGGFSVGTFPDDTDADSPIPFAFHDPLRRPDSG